MQCRVGAVSQGVEWLRSALSEISRDELRALASAGRKTTLGSTEGVSCRWGEESCERNSKSTFFSLDLSPFMISKEIRCLCFEPSPEIVHIFAIMDLREHGSILVALRP